VLFDGFTVLAQIVNFLILMWLLKRFLYQPVLDTIDAREKRIADLLTDTQNKQHSVALQEAELHQKNDNFEQQRSELLQQAELAVAQNKQRMLDLALASVQQQREAWLAALQEEQSSYKQTIRQLVQQEVFQVLRKALKDLSNVELETQITQVLITRLAQLKPQQRQPFIASKPSAIVVKSAMNLNPENKSLLQQALIEAFNVTLPLRFEVDDKLIGGIEINTAKQKLSWNINDYLSSLEASITASLNAKISTANETHKLIGAGNV